MQTSNIDQLYDLDVAAFEDPSAFSDDGKFSIEPGMYTAVCVGFGAFKHIYDGKDMGTVFNLFWQVQNKGGNVINLRGNRWKISSNEKANFRKDLANWFGIPASDWAKIVDLLKKKKVFNPKVPKINMAAFIGAKATLMVTTQAAKNGKSYLNIVSISKADPNVQVPVADIPQWLIKDALDYKLMDGVSITQPKKKEEAKGNKDMGKAVPDKLPDNVPDDADDDLPFN